MKIEFTGRQNASEKWLKAKANSEYFESLKEANSCTKGLLTNRSVIPKLEL